jgi:hypothetical protein
MKIYGLVTGDVPGGIFAGVTFSRPGDRLQLSDTRWVLGIYPTEKQAQDAYERWSDAMEGTKETDPVLIPEMPHAHHQCVDEIVAMARHAILPLYYFAADDYNSNWYCTSSGRKTDYTETRRSSDREERAALGTYADWEAKYDRVDFDLLQLLKGRERF